MMAKGGNGGFTRYGLAASLAAGAHTPVVGGAAACWSAGMSRAGEDDCNAIG